MSFTKIINERHQRVLINDDEHRISWSSWGNHVVLRNMDEQWRNHGFHYRFNTDYHNIVKMFEQVTSLRYVKLGEASHLFKDVEIAMSDVKLTVYNHGLMLMEQTNQYLVYWDDNPYVPSKSKKLLTVDYRNESLVV